jgi:fluoroacetyl-CoA thioesterase
MKRMWEQPMSESGIAGETVRVNPGTPEVASLPEPAVLPLSRVSQLMEHAAARVMRPMLRDGESSIALSLNLTHAVTGPVSGNLRAVATKQEIAGRVHHFVVHVFDESGLVASAEHSRAVVTGRRVEGIARRRLGRRSMQLAI